MKKIISSSFLSALFLGLTFSSCKKTDDNTEPESTEVTTTTSLSERQAISDNAVEDANDIFMNAAGDNNVIGGRPSDVLTPCGSVNITPADGFPKTITIDFGTGCTGLHGVVRSGIIKIVISDSVRKVGSTAVMTFENYVVNGFKQEGKVTWTNTSSAGVKSWKRVVEGGKTTNTLNNEYWLHSGTKYVTQIEGGSTPRIVGDDVFSITGSHTVINSEGRQRTCTIAADNPLIKANACRFVQKGSIKIQGPRHYAVIDYGTGDCDNKATISIDGGTAVEFTLR